ncbi:hypothetical protein [Photobacterium leiognathi]|uniref:hypothetical protein n=1 Tax=Photobacterium leiognathi TaxID=553611 RepID=UPI002981B34E|nr:hypothetical protein [Photobacterium leiognathi]
MEQEAIIKWFDSHKRIGFLRAVGSGEEFYFDLSSVNKGSIVRGGSVVKFIPSVNHRGNLAVNISSIRPLPCMVCSSDEVLSYADSTASMVCSDCYSLKKNKFKTLVGVLGVTLIASVAYIISLSKVF